MKQMKHFVSISISNILKLIPCFFLPPFREIQYRISKETRKLYGIEWMMLHYLFYFFHSAEEIFTSDFRK